jgi:hypothetical protein
MPSSFQPMPGFRECLAKAPTFRNYFFPERRALDKKKKLFSKSAPPR